MTLSFIDKYEIVSTLGRGSMGVVYKAQDPEIGRLVAIKTLKSVFMGDDAAGNEALQRFRQESRSAGKLHHPNIVTIFEAGRTDNGSPYIVMEYIEGKSVEAMLAEAGAMEPLAVLHYLAQISSAIDYAHSQSVIHRDIKPSNIIVDARHRPYLLDFGVAKLSDTSLTPAGTVVGTPSYMSPEQIRGAQLDGRTDLFSLAVVAFEAFTGSRPFPGADFTTVVSNIIHKEPLTFADVGSALPAELETVLKKGLEKERDDRYPSALDFIDSVARVLGVVIDGTGIAGGYTPGLKLPDSNAREIGNRTRAATVVGTFHPASEDSNVSTPVPPQAGSVSTYGGSASGNSLAAAMSGMPSAASSSSATGTGSGSPLSSGSSPAPSKDSASGSGTGFPPVASGFDTDSNVTVTTGAAFSESATSFQPIASATDDSLISRPTGANALSSKGAAARKKSTALVPALVGLLLFGGIAGAGFAFREKITQLLWPEDPEGGEDQGEDSELTPTDIPPEPPPATPVKKVEPTKAPTPVVEQSKPKWVKPNIAPGGYSDSVVAALKDEEIAWLLSPENTDPEGLRLALVEAGKRSSGDITLMLVGLARNPDFKVRVDVLKALSKNPEHYHRPEAVAVIQGALQDSEFIVRGFAVKILTTAQGAQAIPLLEGMLSVEKNAVVLKVLNDSLSQLKGPAR